MDIKEEIGPVLMREKSTSCSDGHRSTTMSVLRESQVIREFQFLEDMPCEHGEEEQTSDIECNGDVTASTEPSDRESSSENECGAHQEKIEYKSVTGNNCLGSTGESITYESSDTEASCNGNTDEHNEYASGDNHDTTDPAQQEDVSKVPMRSKLPEELAAPRQETQFIREEFQFLDDMGTTEAGSREDGDSSVAMRNQENRDIISEGTEVLKANGQSQASGRHHETRLISEMFEFLPTENTEDAKPAGACNLDGGLVTVVEEESDCVQDDDGAADQTSTVHNHIDSSTAGSTHDVLVVAEVHNSPAKSDQNSTSCFKCSSADCKCQAERQSEQADVSPASTSADSSQIQKSPVVIKRERLKHKSRSRTRDSSHSCSPDSRASSVSGAVTHSGSRSGSCDSVNTGEDSDEDDDDGGKLDCRQGVFMYNIRNMELYSVLWDLQNVVFMLPPGDHDTWLIM